MSVSCDRSSVVLSRLRCQDLHLSRHTTTLDALASGPPKTLHPVRADIPADNAGRTLRSFTYQALGQLAARQPQLFARDTSAAARFFQVKRAALSFHEFI